MLILSDAKFEVYVLEFVNFFNLFVRIAAIGVRGYVLAVNSKVDVELFQRSDTRLVGGIKCNFIDPFATCYNSESRD